MEFQPWTVEEPAPRGERNEFFNHIGKPCTLLHQKNAWAVHARHEEVTEVLWHRPEIGGDQNPLMPGREGQHFWIGHAFQFGLVR